MTTYDNMDRNANVALGLLFGTIIGMGVGMLVAPRSGKETRAHLRTRAIEAEQGMQRQLARRRDMAIRTLSKSLDKSKELVDKGSQRAQDADTQAQ